MEILDSLPGTLQNKQKTIQCIRNGRIRRFVIDHLGVFGFNEFRYILYSHVVDGDTANTIFRPYHPDGPCILTITGTSKNSQT